MVVQLQPRRCCGSDASAGFLPAAASCCCTPPAQVCVCEAQTQTGRTVLNRGCGWNVSLFNRVCLCLWLDRWDTSGRSRSRVFKTKKRRKPQQREDELPVIINNWRELPLVCLTSTFLTEKQRLRSVIQVKWMFFEKFSQFL